MTMERQYTIMSNIDSMDFTDRWIVIFNTNKIYVSEVIIECESHTSTSQHEVKNQLYYALKTKGVLQIQDGIAIIKESKSKRITKDVIKTITYRVCATSVTFLSAIALGMPIEYSAILSLGEILVKPMIYFTHERVWNRIKK